jgi:predicted metal-dependent hydrolase
MKKRNASKKPEVPIRHMKFDFDPSKAPKYCWDDNSWGSAFILTFSAFIPAGERFVIDAVREFRDQSKDPELRELVTGLIGQEAAHSRIHAEFNNMYDIKGLPINRLVKQSEKIYLKFLLPRLPKKTTLAIAAGIEHVTAVLAEGSFARNTEAINKMEGVTKDFLIWHLLEELEHKSVAFDLYEEIDGSYWHRVFAFLLIWSISIPFGYYSLTQILKTPGFSQGKHKNRQGRAYQMSMTKESASQFLAYFRKDFHPDNVDTSELLEEWREKLLGDKGELSEFVTRVITPESKRQSADNRKVG